MPLANDVDATGRFRAHADNGHLGHAPDMPYPLAIRSLERHTVPTRARRRHMGDERERRAHAGGRSHIGCIPSKDTTIARRASVALAIYAVVYVMQGRPFLTTREQYGTVNHGLVKTQ